MQFAVEGLGLFGALQRVLGSTAYKGWVYQVLLYLSAEDRIYFSETCRWMRDFTRSSDLEMEMRFDFLSTGHIPLYTYAYECGFFLHEVPFSWNFRVCAEKEGQAGLWLWEHLLFTPRECCVVALRNGHTALLDVCIRKKWIDDETLVLSYCSTIEQLMMLEDRLGYVSKHFDWDDFGKWNAVYWRWVLMHQHDNLYNIEWLRNTQDLKHIVHAFTLIVKDKNMLQHFACMVDVYVQDDIDCAVVGDDFLQFFADFKCKCGDVKKHPRLCIEQDKKRIKISNL